MYQDKTPQVEHIFRHKSLVQILIAKGTRLLCELKPNIVKVDNGARIPTRTIIIATGAEYRRLPLKNLSRFEGLGIYYALHLWMHNPVMGERRLWLEAETQQDKLPCFWQRAKRVHMLRRLDGLTKSISRYLIRQIDETPTIVLWPNTEIMTLE